MDPESIATAVWSSDPDQVNQAIDDIKELDVGERVELFDDVFEELADIYGDSDDGYVRQSTVRVAEQFIPGITIEVELSDNPGLEDRVTAQVDTLCGFLLQAMEDEDGRVRQSAKRALRPIYRSYDALGDEETLDALCAELETMAESAPEERRKHLLETKEDAEYILRSPTDHLLKGIRQLGERSENG